MRKHMTMPIAPNGLPLRCSGNSKLLDSYPNSRRLDSTIKKRAGEITDPFLCNFKDSIAATYFPIAACAAARRAIGTRKGEQLT